MILRKAINLRVDDDIEVNERLWRVADYDAWKNNTVLLTLHCLSEKRDDWKLTLHETDMVSLIP